MSFFRILLFFVSFLVVLKANASDLSQHFNVEVGVFDAAEVKINFNDFDDKFVILTEVETANFFGKLYPFKAKYEARAVSDYKTNFIPIIYMTETKTNNHIRTKKIFYNEKGKAYKRVSSKDDRITQKDIKNVPESADSGDLQSVFIELIKNFEKFRSCEMEREIYDGKKHYKVIIENKGVENRWFDFLKKNENAYKCSVYIKNLKKNNDNILWDVSAEKPINMWFGVDKNSKMPKIYEIKIDKTMVGDIVVYPSN